MTKQTTTYMYEFWIDTSRIWIQVIKIFKLKYRYLDISNVYW